MVIGEGEIYGGIEGEKIVHEQNAEKELRRFRDDGFSIERWIVLD